MKLVKTVWPKVACNEITMDGLQCALSTLSLHSGSVRQREDRVRGVGEVGGGIRSLVQGGAAE